MKLFGKEKNAQAAENTEGQKEAKSRKRKKTVKRVIKLVILLIILAAAAFYVYTRFFARQDAPKEITYTYAEAERRDIVEELSGSGTLESADSYTLSTRVGGDILSDTFAEGDTVNKDDVLYVLDSSDMDESLERAKKNLQKSQETYNEKIADRQELTITAPISGVVSGLTLDEEDSVKADAVILTIKNISTLTITEYYSTEYMDDIYVGMPATVSIPGQMLNVSGTVSKISALTRASETGVICFPVTIEIENPGSLLIGATATAWLSGNIYPTITSTEGLAASATKTVTAGVGGDVEALHVTNGDIVSAGMVLLELSGEDLEDAIEDAEDAVEDAQLSLDNLYESLENYTLTAPIDGTVVRKVLKAGETAESGDTLCMIYDLSYLTVSLAIDELDIKSVAVGQTAKVTADAVDGTVFEGVVTRVGVNGTTSGGVTTYPVDIRIDVTDGLLPGMNVDIVITVEEVTDVLTIPVDAVERNNRVLIKTKDGSTGEGSPEGMQYVTVEIGMADEDYVEIVSGLSDGDTVAYISRTITTSNNAFGMMPGGMMPGGMPGGMQQGGNRTQGGGRTQGGMPGGGF